MDDCMDEEDDSDLEERLRKLGEPDNAGSKKGSY